MGDREPGPTAMPSSVYSSSLRCHVIHSPAANNGDGRFGSRHPVGSCRRLRAMSALFKRCSVETPTKHTFCSIWLCSQIVIYAHCIQVLFTLFYSLTSPSGCIAAVVMYPPTCSNVLNLYYVRVLINDERGSLVQRIEEAKMMSNSQSQFCGVSCPEEKAELQASISG